MRFNPLVLAVVLIAATPVWAGAIEDVKFGDEALDRGNHDLAIQYFTRAIQSKELSIIYLGVAFNNRGNAYNQKGLYDRAINDYDQVIRLVPSFSKAFNNRGLAYDRKGLLDRAINDFDQAINLDAEYTDAYLNRGVAFAKKGDYGRAIPDFEHIISLNPKHARAFYNRGTVYINQGFYDRGKPDLEKAKRLDPSYAPTYYSLGTIYSMERRYGQANENLDQAIRLDPNNSNAIRSRGRVRFYQGKFKAAIPDLATAVRLDPTNVYAALWLYLARSRAGKDGKRMLDKDAEKLDLDQWPGQVIDFYLGDYALNELKNLTINSNPRVKSERECEYFFYVGEYHMIRRDKKAAARMFQRALGTGVTNSFEYIGAKAALERLGG